METDSKEVGGVGAVAGAEVGHCDSNFRAHRGQCAGFVGWVGAGGEGEGEGDQSRDRCGGDGNGGDGRGGGGGGVGGDRCGDGDREMEVEETLKEMEKSVDEGVMEE